MRSFFAAARFVAPSLAPPVRPRPSALHRQSWIASPLPYPPHVPHPHRPHRPHHNLRAFCTSDGETPRMDAPARPRAWHRRTPLARRHHSTRRWQASLSPPRSSRLLCRLLPPLPTRPSPRRCSTATPVATAATAATGRTRVAVAMSGGVDSTVAAYLLAQRPELDVFGVYMQNWDEVEETGVCESEAEYARVGRICKFERA